MTPEVQALIAAMSASGLPHRVTSTQRAPRFDGDRSYHILGQAADFAGLTPWNVAQAHPPLTAIWQYWMGKAGSLSELIYSGAPFWISGGRVLPISTLSSSLRAAHWNHVHVAVPKGWRYTPEIIVPEVSPMPDYGVVAAPVSLSITPTGNGYIILCADGGVFAFGDAKYLGRVHKV